MKTIFVLLLILIQAISGCDKQPEEKSYPGHANTFELNQGLTNDNLAWCDLIKKVEYIPLETTRESLVGEIKKVLLWNDELILWDKSTYKLLRFGKDGRFKNVIAEPGSQPGQFASLNDFFLDTLTATIHCLDPSLNQLMIFDLEGNFLDYGVSFKPYQLTPMSLYFNNGALYTFTPRVFNKFDNYLVHKFDHTGELQSKFFPWDHPLYLEQPIENVRATIHPDEGLLFFKDFDSNIYKEANGEWSILGQVAIRNFAPEKSMDNSANYFNLLENLDANGLTKGLESVFFAGNMAWFTHSNTGLLYQSLQDFAVGRSMTFSKIKSSVEFCPYSEIVGSSGTRFVGIVNSEGFPREEFVAALLEQTKVLESGQSEKISNWLNAWKTRSEFQDNPILALLDLQLPET